MARSQKHSIQETEFNESHKVRLFDCSQNKDRRAIERLVNSEKIFRITDLYKEQQREYFAINNPSKALSGSFETEFQCYYKKLGERKSILHQGKWVYYPWLGLLAHILDEIAYTTVRTARNQYLVTQNEQRLFYNTRVAIAGLSVGYSILLALVLEGGCRNIKIADSDKLELSNMNRVPVGVDQLGQKKTHIAARKILEINPYAKIGIFSEGLHKKNLNKFVGSTDIIIDEIDDFGIKILLRKLAKRKRIPILSAIDNEESGLLDIERYDIRKSTQLFHNRLGKIDYDAVRSMNKKGIGRLIARLVGPENSTKKMHYSLNEIGKSIVSWPQLGGTALLNGAMVAYCVRKISNQAPLLDGRVIVSLDEQMIPNYNSKRTKLSRQKDVQKFLKQMNND